MGSKYPNLKISHHVLGWSILVVTEAKFDDEASCLNSTFVKLYDFIFQHEALTSSRIQFCIGVRGLSGTFHLVFNGLLDKFLQLTSTNHFIRFWLRIFFNLISLLLLTFCNLVGGVYTIHLKTWVLVLFSSSWPFFNMVGDSLHHRGDMFILYLHIGSRTFYIFCKKGNLFLQ